MIKQVRNAAIAIWVVPLTALAAGGPLTPPGPPQVTQKSLQSVEPRLDLADVPGSGTAMHLITNRGSYYLSGDLDVTTLNGIDIQADGVTLDLNGFSIYRSSPAAATGSAIIFGMTHRQNIIIRDGNITSGSSFFGAGPGFDSGIMASSPPYPENVQVSRINVLGCAVAGIFLGTEPSTVVDHCVVHDIFGIGIQAGIVRHSAAISCEGDAINAREGVVACRGHSTGEDGIEATGGTVTDSYGTTAGTDLTDEGINSWIVVNSRGFSSGGGGIVGRVVSSCIGTTAGAGVSVDGIGATYVVHASFGSSSSGDGIRVFSGNATDCFGLSTGPTSADHGIQAAGNVENSVGVSDNGHGISATMNVANSHGVTSGTDTSVRGITASANVMNSYGESASSDAIFGSQVSHSYGRCHGTGAGIEALFNVSHSYGIAAVGNGIEAGGNVAHSYGLSTGSAAGDGINALQNVENSTGVSSGDDGIEAQNVFNSSGYANSTNAGTDGIRANANVMNSLGKSMGDDGIDAFYTISYSRGESTGSGVGLECELAIGCTESGGQTIVNKYLMP